MHQDQDSWIWWEEHLLFILLDAGIQRFGLIYVPVVNQFDVSSRNASNTIFKARPCDDRWCAAARRGYPNRGIYWSLDICWSFDIWTSGNNQQLGIFDDWDPGPAEKIMRGPTEFVMIGILSIFADWVVKPPNEKTIICFPPKPLRCRRKVSTVDAYSMPLSLMGTGSGSCTKRVNWKNLFTLIWTDRFKKAVFKRERICGVC